MEIVVALKNMQVSQIFQHIITLAMPWDFLSIAFLMNNEK